MNHEPAKTHSEEKNQKIKKSGASLPFSRSSTPSRAQEDRVFFWDLFMTDGNGAVFLYRRIRDHWIAQDHTTLAVFLQILTRVEWRDDVRSVYFNGCQVNLKRGQMTCGRKQLAKWAHISEKQCRNALMKLKTANTMAIKTNNKFSIITLLNWDKYQIRAIKTANKQADDGPTMGRRRATLEEGNKVINKEKNMAHPILKDIEVLFLDQKSTTQEAEKFFNYYEANGWRVGKNPMKNWKAAATGWILRNAAPRKPVAGVVKMVKCHKCQEELPEGEMNYHQLKHQSQEQSPVLEDLVRETAKNIGGEK